ncbi:MAG: circularly permuted type 2 ATP-grasp protein [Pseudomonadota bacterium]
MFRDYELDGAFDEMFLAPGKARPHFNELFQQLKSIEAETLGHRQSAVEKSFMDQGITFTVYGDEGSIERIFPTDCLPRIIPAKEWEQIEAGLTQRLQAINLFLSDVYHEEKIILDGIVPRELIYNNKHYRREMRGVRVPHDVYVNVCGSDLIRDADGQYRILEDNLRVPSGASYMLVNREIIRRSFPAMYRNYNVRGVEHYGRELLNMLKSLTPLSGDDPTIVLLTPGVYNSAYFEHAFLAQQMGVPLVEGRDLVTHDNKVYMRTTDGLTRVDVIYRRVDDDFIDPVIFRRDSMLGVPGLMNAYRAGNIAIANALGTGVADDKALYAYLPRIIKYYLDEEPILQNVETYLCREDKGLQYTLDRLEDLVVKAVGESGGYGMLIGPHASKSEIEAFRSAIKAEPANYIAQPTLNFSRGPCIVENGVEARHVDLRPFLLHGENARLIPGGLTRVALRRGSLVVNSSQGGGSKDTWVLDE